MKTDAIGIYRTKEIFYGAKQATWMGKVLLHFTIRLNFFNYKINIGAAEVNK